MEREKNKRASERRLIEAVSTIVEEEGFSKVRINHVARIAECDKVLIYRYFGGIEGLVSAWAKENDFYTAALDIFYEEVKTAQKSNLRELCKKVLLSQMNFMRENRMMQELKVWELSGNSRFKILQDIREKNGQKLQQALNELVGLDNRDMSLYITVLVTAIEHLVLCTRQYPLFNGVDFGDSQSWERFEKVIKDYVDMLFDTLNL